MFPCSEIKSQWLYYIMFVHCNYSSVNLMYIIHVMITTDNRRNIIYLITNNINRWLLFTFKIIEFTPEKCNYHLISAVRDLRTIIIGETWIGKITQIKVKWNASEHIIIRFQQNIDNYRRLSNKYELYRMWCYTVGHDSIVFLMKQCILYNFFLKNLT